MHDDLRVPVITCYHSAVISDTSVEAREGRRRHYCGALSWGIIVGHYCEALLWGIIVGHYCEVLLLQAPL